MPGFLPACFCPLQRARARAPRLWFVVVVCSFVTDMMLTQPDQVCALTDHVLTSFAGGPRVTRRVCCFRHLQLFAKGPAQNHAMSQPAIEVQIALGYLKDLEDRVARLVVRKEQPQTKQTTSAN